MDHGVCTIAVLAVRLCSCLPKTLITPILLKSHSICPQIKRLRNEYVHILKPVASPKNFRNIKHQMHWGHDFDLSRSHNIIAFSYNCVISCTVWQVIYSVVVHQCVIDVTQS